MKRTLTLVVGILVALSLAPAGITTAKGGWATSTLDPLPPLVPGEPADIGFTVRRHGVTPVDLSDFGKDDVGIAFYTGKEVEFFAAEAQGTVGHHVARVVVPDAGTYRWEVRQGMFASQPLGSIHISTGDPSVGSQGTLGGQDLAWLDVVRWSSIGLAIGLGLVVAVDLLKSRRRRSIARQV